ncbi:MAG: hypothetical protein ACP5UV_01920 [Thermoplasmata archaeon]
MEDGKLKNLKYIFEGSYTQDGAGVKLKRIFGSQRSAMITDPFLLMDSFGSDDLNDYIRGYNR